MATGDIKNNLRKLKSELKQIQYLEELDFEKMLVGVTTPYLLILHHVFAEYSCELSSYFASKGYDFYGKSDIRFIEVVYKILIQEFTVKPMLTKHQFFSIGYAEIKVIFISKIIYLCRQKNNEILIKLCKKKIRSNNSTSKKSSDKFLPSSDSTVEVSIKNHTEKNNVLNKEKSFGNVLNDNRLSPEPVTEAVANQQRSRPSILQKIIAPEPHPDLALTPVKTTLFKNSGTYITEQILPDITEINDSALDTTDFGESVLTGNVEFVDIDETQAQEPLPLFTVTKHESNQLVNKNIKGKINTCLFPSNKETFKLSQSKSDVIDSCKQCMKNSDMISKLCDRIECLENSFKDMAGINNDLSAKLILMETKIKLMENQNVFEKQQDLAKQDMKVNLVKQGDRESLVMGDATENLGQQVSNGNLVKQHTESSIKQGSIESLFKQGNKQNLIDEVEMNNYDDDDRRKHILNKEFTKEYSPIEYTDDDIIIQDFIPMRMKDVHKLMDVANDNKENNISFIEQSVFNEGFDRSPNVSQMFGDDITKQTVQNVKRRLKETELLLKNSTSHLLS